MEKTNIIPRMKVGDEVWFTVFGDIICAKIQEIEFDGRISPEVNNVTVSYYTDWDIAFDIEEEHCYPTKEALLQHLASRTGLEWKEAE